MKKDEFSYDYLYDEIKDIDSLEGMDAQSRRIRDEDYSSKSNKDNMGIFHRNELTTLRDRANLLAGITSNSTWKRAYEDLANAADHLDAMTARVELGPMKTKTNKILNGEEFEKMFPLKEVPSGMIKNNDDSPNALNYFLRGRPPKPVGPPLRDVKEGNVPKRPLK